MDSVFDVSSGWLTSLTNASFSVKLSLSVGVAFLFYYKLKIVKIPRVIGKKGFFYDFIVNNVPVVTEPFAPSPILFPSSLQTISSTILKGCPSVVWDEAEDIDLPDNGQVHLYWMHCSANCDSKYAFENRPTVLLLPGLTGNNEANYICHFTKLLQPLGYRVAVFTYRGMAGKGLKTPKTYCACYTDDMLCVVEHIKARFPDAPLMAVGVSLGGMILSHYLIRTGEKSGLVAAMTVSVPFNPFESTKTLTTLFNRFFFNRHLTNALLRNIETHLDMFKEVVNVDHVKESSTIHEFDESFTRRVFGFESLDHYYSTAQISDKIDRIRTPLLMLNACDDPFSPGYCIPVDAIKETDSVTLVLTEHGGHVAFIDTVFAGGQSYLDRLFMQYVHAVFTNIHAFRH